MTRNRIPSSTRTADHPMDQVNLIGKLADLKDSHYRNTLALTALLDLLIEKGLITEQELQARAAQLDSRI